MSEEKISEREAEEEINMLLDHLLNRIPEMREGLVEDCLTDGCVKISFEPPDYILTLKIEKRQRKRGEEDE